MTGRDVLSCAAGAGRPDRLHGRLLVLHVLAVRKAATAQSLAVSAGLDQATLAGALDSAVADDLVADFDGTFVLTEAGEEAVTQGLRTRLAGMRADAEVAALFERFEAVNRTALAVFTDSQTLRIGGTPVPNDHSDADYDSGVLDRLWDVHETLERVLGPLVERDPRFGQYLRRLAAALAEIEQGRWELLNGVREDAYHTAWFELHEDLLRTLDRERRE